jgi:gliding motility-associated-like protein
LKTGILILICLVACKGLFSQASFQFIDSTCINTSITINNTSTNSLTICWSFDSLNIDGAKTSVNLGILSSTLNTTTAGTIVEDAGNYYLFVTNSFSLDLIRCDLGINPLNTIPIATHILTNVLPGGHNEAAQFIKENGSWYCIVDGGTTSSAFMSRLNFGTSITNLNPTVTPLSVPLLGNWPHQLEIFKNGSNYLGFVICRTNGDVQRVDFGSSITNTPTITSVYTSSNPSVGFAMEQENGNWFMMISTNNAPGDLRILNFGTNIYNNAPIVTNLGNVGGLLQAPRAIKLFKSCNQLFGLLSSQKSPFLGYSGYVILLNFQSGITSPITATNLGNFGGNEDFWNMTSNTFWSNNSFHFFTFNPLDSNVTRFDISPTGNTLPLSFSANPSIQYSKSGYHNIQLLTNFGNIDQSNYCSTHFSINNFSISQTISICQHDTAVLQLNNSAHHINWSPSTNLSCTNCIAPKAYPSSTTTYIATDSINHCFSIDTFLVNVLACSTCKGTFNFNGNNEVQLPLPDTTYYSSNGFTWECWFKAPQYSTSDSSQNPGHSLLIVEDAVGCEDIVLNFGWTGVKRNYLGFVVDGPGACANRDVNPCRYKPSNGFTPNTWYHAAGVKDYINNTTKLYVNGQLVDTRINTKSPLTRNIRTRISSTIVGLDSGFVGKMDEIRFWRYARSSAEILSQYNTCLAGNENGLVAYYKANEGIGLKAFDAAPFKGMNDATLSSTNIWDTLDNAPIIPKNCTQYSPPTISSNSPICANDTFIFSVSVAQLPSSYKTTWLKNNTIVSRSTICKTVAAGKYFFIAIDSINTCNPIFMDSTLAITLPSTNGVLNVSICQGKNYQTPSGKILNTIGTFYDTISNHNGCDSIITISLALKNKSTSLISASICAGKTYHSASGKTFTTTGNYKDTIQNYRGCDSIITINLFVKNKSLASVSTTICKGNSFISASGKIFSIAGNYKDTIQNYVGCDSIISIQLSTKDSTLTIIKASVCQGKNYTLPNGSIVNSSGIYNTKYISYNGCDSIISVILTVKNKSTAAIFATICNGKSYQSASGKIFTTAGIYKDTIPNFIGCDSIITINLSVKNKSLASVSPSICKGNSFISASGKIFTTAGIYKDTIQNYRGCDSIITINLSVKNKSLASVSATICKGNSFISASGKTFTIAGNYTDTIQNYVGCDSIISIQLSTLDSTLTVINSIICADSIYYLPNGNQVINSGSYFIKYINQYGCDSSILVTVEMVQKPILRFGNDTIICIKTELKLAAYSNYNFYEWNNQSHDSSIIISQPGLYTVTLSNPPCASVVDSIIVNEEICNCNLQISNCFTPNADNENDFFFPYKSCMFELAEYDFKIYNRWGECIFVTQNFNDRWDGTYHSKPQELGTYVYVINYKNEGIENQKTLKGTFHLLR